LKDKILRHTKPLADTLTVTRVILALCVVMLGWRQGKAAFPLVVLLMVISWLTDLLDGPLARYDKTARATWIGEHDADADLSTSLGLTVYLVLSEYFPAWAGIALVLAILLLWLFFSQELAWPFYAAPYGFVLWKAFKEALAFGWLAVAFLGMVLMLRWRRLVYDALPRFFGALAGLYRNPAVKTAATSAKSPYTDSR